ncbi:MAG: hypothetical protein DME25_12550 [Verrucomicrobia bacterium]|nr:MAG: hypothetical protein DME25_12550 [Verrucomicrobiota bacterium]
MQAVERLDGVAHDFNHRLVATVDQRSVQAHDLAVETTCRFGVQPELERLDEIVTGEGRLAAARAGTRHEEMGIRLALKDA